MALAAGSGGDRRQLAAATTPVTRAASPAVAVAAREASEARFESPRKPLERLLADYRSSVGTAASALSCDSSEADTLLNVLVQHPGSNYSSSAALSSYGSVGSDMGRGDATMAVTVEESADTTVMATALPSKGGRWRVSNRILVSAVANLSTAARACSCRRESGLELTRVCLSEQYNLAVINYALIMIRQTHPASSPELTSMVASCSLVGAILGQLTFGYVGALLGRKKGMILTLMLSIAGAAASAVCPWGDEHIYETLALCRLVLGLGVGGVYPLSATTAVESSRDNTKSSKLVAVVFSFQGIGQLLAPLMSYLLLELQVSRVIGWRILLGVGALPGLIVLKQAFNAKESTESEPTSKAELTHPAVDLWSALARDDSLRRKFIGAALGWFLFDITFYGNVIFTPIILADTYGFDQNHLTSVTLCALLVAAIGLPGYYVTIAFVGRMSFRTIQILGFSMMAVLFLVLGVFYTQLLPYRALLLTLYALTFFFSNFGPNVSTFSLPAEIFPSDVRVKLNGIAAACGKLGATVGAAAFGMIEDEWGVSQVLIISALVSGLGVIVTHRYIPQRPLH